MCEISQFSAYLDAIRSSGSSPDDKKLDQLCRADLETCKAEGHVWNEFPVDFGSESYRECSRCGSEAEKVDGDWRVTAGIA